MTELWGLGDLAVAMPFIRTAAQHAKVTLLAKPHAAPLLRQFAPEVNLVTFTAPWTAFSAKYQLHHWPWAELRAVLRDLRQRAFTHVISARPDPREHLFLKRIGAPQLIGFPRLGSGVLLNQSLLPPMDPHRAASWRHVAGHFDWELPSPIYNSTDGRHLVIHTGAAQPVRRWPRERFEAIATKLRESGWNVTLIDETHGDLDALIATLASANRFIGNDSGPGHIAALLGVPTFTIFGPQLSENFAPQHPRAAWIDGSHCPHKPCFDTCHFKRPHCLLDLTVADVWPRVATWLHA